MCANQQGGGVRSRCPHLTAPSPNRQQKQGGGSGSIALPIMHGGARPGAGAGGGEGGGGSQAPCPLPPRRLCRQDSEAFRGPEVATPPRMGAGGVWRVPIRAGSSLRRGPGPEGVQKTGN
ncbi:hypothetical protein P7K49_034111 [Saguinus oedipus]|uniref:Uncharacterized protein n=1 Tax=Saguinus oedipus TaxID=9490 RepID=A0ABQ9TTU2_SAGOE|nr:hypothetical protein P7K49_034111 [Saguinus oedipus]